MKTHEDTVRRFLFGLNQLDSLKNAAAATMLQRADPSSNAKVWKQDTDPNLLLDILHSQHQTIDYLARIDSIGQKDSRPDRIHRPAGDQKDSPQLFPFLSNPVRRRANAEGKERVGVDSRHKIPEQDLLHTLQEAPTAFFQT